MDAYPSYMLKVENSVERYPIYFNKLIHFIFWKKSKLMILLFYDCFIYLCVFVFQKMKGISLLKYIGYLSTEFFTFNIYER